MTIQQLLLSGATPPPLFVDSAQAAASASSITLTATGGTATGDIMLFFASAAGNGNLTWTPPSGVTEVKDAGILPNMFFGYKYATAGGTQSYTFTASKSAYIHGTVIIYRNISTLVSKYSTSSNQSTHVLNMTGTGGYITPCTFVAYAASGQNGVTWSVTGGSPTTLYSGTTGTNGLVWIVLKEDAVTNTNYSLTLGTNFNTIQGMLVAIR